MSARELRSLGSPARGRGATRGRGGRGTAPPNPAPVPAAPLLDISAAAAEAAAAEPRYWFRDLDLEGVASIWNANQSKIDTAQITALVGIYEAAVTATAVGTDPVIAGRTGVAIAAGYPNIAKLVAIFQAEHRPQKGAVSLIKLLCRYRLIDSVSAHAQEVRTEAGDPAFQQYPDPQVTFLFAFSLDSGMLQRMHKKYQDSVKRAAGLPADLSELIGDFDELGRACREYITAEDDLAEQLRQALNSLNERKTARVDEIRPLREAIQRFNRDRSGALTDDGRARAIAEYRRTPNLSDRMTLPAFLDYCQQKKAKSFLEANRESFRAFAAREKAGQLAARRALIPAVPDVLQGIAASLGAGTGGVPADAGVAGGAQVDAVEMEFAAPDDFAL
jgi:hypothetical protein